MKTFFTMLSIFVLNFTTVSGQSFTIENYSDFLLQHQNMAAGDLMQMHPAGKFEKRASGNWEHALFHDSIEIKYDLTAHEKGLISQHGFVVSERLQENSFHAHFYEIWKNDLPVFISTDAILHAFHASYDKILRDVELGMLEEKLQDLLDRMHGELAALESRYAGQPDMQPMIKDVDFYLTVPRKILDETAAPYYTENFEKVDSMLQFIAAEQPVNYPLFSGKDRFIDFSQFTPRGHYDNPDYPALKKYFQAMMWLGRIEIYLIAPTETGKSPEEQPTDKDIQRQAIDAVLMSELVNLAGAQTLYDEIESTIAFFVGEQDNVTLPNLNALLTDAALENAAALLDSVTFSAFQDTLSTKSYAFQQILSQLLWSDPLSPEQIKPASAFLLFGQRFVVDSYVTGSVVYDKIEFNDRKICRLFPSTLDILFALGNDAAAQLIKPELDQYHYASNLAALRYLIESYPEEFWESSLYNAWLGILRTLNPPADRAELPEFMQTAAWWQQKMNGQLSSWTELRHDNLLYAKQSYTPAIICSYPYSYVEPAPEFYEAFVKLAETASKRFGQLPFNHEYIQTQINDYFSKLKEVSEKLASIARKELQGANLSESETHFLQDMISYGGVCGESPYHGWYSDLFYDQAYWDYREEKELVVDFCVADYHTTPTDCGGGLVGWVLHAGTGPIDLLITTAEMPDGKSVAFIGPVAGYYEYTTTNFKRLNDTNWRDIYLHSALRPEWVNLYLANDAGHSRGDGPVLITAVDDNGEPAASVPQTHIFAQNYPNPFNATTVIAFTIPHSLANQTVTLTVYDLNGRQIATLLERSLPPGHYLTQWDGRDDGNRAVASGSYFYRLSVGSQAVDGKMQLVK